MTKSKLPTSGAIVRKLLGVVFSTFIIWLIQWFIVSRWGWEVYGKFYFWIFMGMQGLTFLCYSICLWISLL